MPVINPLWVLVLVLLILAYQAGRIANELLSELRQQKRHLEEIARKLAYLSQVSGSIEREIKRELKSTPFDNDDFPPD